MKKRTNWFKKRTAVGFVASTLVISNANVLFDFPNSNAQEINPDDQMTSVIVEMEGVPAIESLPKTELIGATSSNTERKLNQQIESLRQSHGKVLQKVKDKRIPYTKSNEFTFSFNGMSLKVPKNKLEELRSLPGVKAVYPDKEVRANLTKSVPLIGATDVWNKKDKNNQDATGKGVTVAVIDTGVDYTHPDLGGALGAGHKIVGGYDFVNKDADPMDDQGHGTHVAGIIGANGNLMGVAPDVSITAYKVLDNNGGGSTSDVIAGIEASISPDNPYPADVINMSLGGAGDENDPVSKAAQNAVDAGVVVVAAAGNNGPNYGTIGAPAIAKGVLAVGASLSGIKVPELKMISPVKENLKVSRLDFSANPQEAPTTREVVDVGKGGSEKFEGKDVKGKIVLIQIPHDVNPYLHAYTESIRAEEKGAYATVFFQPDQDDSAGPGAGIGNVTSSLEKSNPFSKFIGQHQFKASSSMDGRLDSLIAMGTDDSTAQEIKSNLANGPVKLMLTGKDGTDLMASFSSRGDFNGKPDLVAPGVEIKSTYIKTEYNDSGYTRISGTSMAAPHVAGAAALLKQLKPTWKSTDISSNLKETVKRLSSYDVDSQGAGRLDIKAAVETNVVASPNALNFGMADLKGSKIQKSATLTLNNYGDKPVEIDFTIKDDIKSEAAITVNPSHIQIKPGRPVNVTVNINMKRPEQDTNITGWVEGKIKTGKNSQHLRIPYQFIVRHFQITATPDPTPSTVNESTAYIYSPVQLSQAPKVTLRTPNGKTKKVTAVLDQGRWWKAKLPIDESGIYRIDSSSKIKNSLNEEMTIIGSGYMEKLTPNKEKETNWKSVGPYSNTGLINFGKKNSNQMRVLGKQHLSFFRSEDNAKTWNEYQNFPAADGDGRAIVVDPTNDKNLFVALNSYQSDPTYIGKIVTSNDGGKSWKNLPSPNVFIVDLMIDKSGKKLVMITEHEIYVSTDRGINWTKKPGSWTNLTKSKLHNNDLYFYSYFEGINVIKDVFSGVAKSKLLYTPQNGTFINEIDANDDILIASTTNTDKNGMYISLNKGKDWKELTHNGIPFKSVSRLEILERNIYVGTAYDGIWRSDDKGKSWKVMKKPLPGYRSYEIDFELGPKSTGKEKRQFYVASDQAGIYKTQNDGESYKRIGIPGANIYSLAIARNSKGYQLLAGTISNTYMTPLPTQKKVDSSVLEWGTSGSEGMVGEAVQHIATSPKEQNVVYKIRSGTDGPYFYSSKDGGKKWDLKSKPKVPPLDLIVSPTDSNQIIISYYIPLTNERGIIISIDGGVNWKKYKQNHIFFALAADPKDPNRIWAGGNEGLFLSKDKGKTFEKIQNISVNSISIDSKNPKHIVVGGNHLYLSKNGGKTFEKAQGVGSDELHIKINDILISPKNSKIIYAATGAFREYGLLKKGRGVLMSVDGGKTWKNISNGLQNRNATALELSPDEQFLFVGTQGGSVHRLNLTKK
ncbi:S8 family serine peptidase [Bacillus sp. AL-1R]